MNSDSNFRLPCVSIDDPEVLTIDIIYHIVEDIILSKIKSWGMVPERDNFRSVCLEVIDKLFGTDAEKLLMIIRLALHQYTLINVAKTNWAASLRKARPVKRDIYLVCDFEKQLADITKDMVPHMKKDYNRIINGLPTMPIPRSKEEFSKLTREEMINLFLSGKVYDKTNLIEPVDQSTQTDTTLSVVKKPNISSHTSNTTSASTSSSRKSSSKSQEQTSPHPADSTSVNHINTDNKKQQTLSTNTDNIKSKKIQHKEPVQEDEGVVTKNLDEKNNTSSFSATEVREKNLKRKHTEMADEQIEQIDEDDTFQDESTTVHNNHTQPKNTSHNKTSNSMNDKSSNLGGKLKKANTSDEKTRLQQQTNDPSFAVATSNSTHFSVVDTASHTNTSHHNNQSVNNHNDTNKKDKSTNNKHPTSLPVIDDGVSKPQQQQIKKNITAPKSDNSSEPNSSLRMTLKPKTNTTSSITSQNNNEVKKNNSSSNVPSNTVSTTANVNKTAVSSAPVASEKSKERTKTNSNIPTPNASLNVPALNNKSEFEKKVTPHEAPKTDLDNFDYGGDDMDVSFTQND